VRIAPGALPASAAATLGAPPAGAGAATSLVATGFPAGLLGLRAQPGAIDVYYASTPQNKTRLSANVRRGRNTHATSSRGPAFYLCRVDALPWPRARVHARPEELGRTRSAFPQIRRASPAVTGVRLPAPQAAPTRPARR
jgi:hypothetical protein